MNSVKIVFDRAFSSLHSFVALSIGNELSVGAIDALNSTHHLGKHVKSIFHLSLRPHLWRDKYGENHFPKLNLPSSCSDLAHSVHSAHSVQMVDSCGGMEVGGGGGCGIECPFDELPLVDVSEFVVGVVRWAAIMAARWACSR